MKHFFLTEIVTKDNLIHQGIYYKPKKPTKRVILWVHGLTSTFYNNVKLFELMADACEKEGIGFAAFNNRGHDIVTGIRKIDPGESKGYARVNGGAGYERFEDCIFDIDAGISFLVTQGYTEIILIGHSTGSNKVCYYCGTRKDSKVTGVVLLSPVSDQLDPTLDKEIHRKQLYAMQRRIKEGKGDELMTGAHVFPLTPRRFVSIFTHHSSEDVFDYGDLDPKLTCFSLIKEPLLVILGCNDEYLDRPVKNVFDVFTQHTRSKKYYSVVIPDALHSYNGKEQEVVSIIFHWMKEI